MGRIGFVFIDLKSVFLVLKIKPIGAEAQLITSISNISCLSNCSQYFIEFCLTSSQ
jgi:hypothetical protein